MRKHIVWMVVLIAVLLASCAHRTEVLGEPKMYEVGSEIHSLDIQISAADFTIVQAEEFSVESNLKNLTVSEKALAIGGGVLEAILTYAGDRL